MAPSVPANELPDEFASEVGAAPATPLLQFQIFSVVFSLSAQYLLANAKVTHIIKSILSAIIKLLVHISKFLCFHIQILYYLHMTRNVFFKL